MVLCGTGDVRVEREIYGQSRNTPLMSTQHEKNDSEQVTTPITCCRPHDRVTWYAVLRNPTEPLE